MTERPIIFSGPMIRALLDGRKTQTRRVLKNAGYEPHWRPELSTRGEWLLVANHEDCRGRISAGVRYAVGDLLWVREAIAPRYFNGGKPAYRADWSAAAADVAKEPKWTPSIHMPRTASRITLKVTGVQVERLNDISDDDCEAEGIESDLWDMCAVYRDYTGTKDDWFYTWPDAFDDNGLRYCEWGKDIQRKSFRSLWESIHGPGSWEANPWVVALSFDAILKNVGEAAP
ncbi:MAG: hypothetical protein KF723_22270 [Rhizobiaceae bacterium]|nr:hypothetical protein [Rhizobiaceae bacterium]